LRTDHIATSRQSASGAIVPAVREGLGHGRAAHARLAGTARVHLHQYSPGAFCLVRELLDKGVPSGIVNGLGQHSAGEPLHVQILNGDQAVLLNQLVRELVLEVGPLVPHVSVSTLQQPHRFAVAIALFVSAPRHLPLSTAKPSFRCAVVPGVGDLRPIGQRGEKPGPSRSIQPMNWVALGAPPMLGAEYLTPAILLGRPRRPPVSGVRLGCSGE